MPQTTTWKLLAGLAALNLTVGVILIVADLAFGVFGRSPGSMAMLGASAMGLPWLALAQHFRAHLQSEARRLEHENRRRSVEIERAEAEVAYVRQLSATGVHRTLGALAQEHGANTLARALDNLRGHSEREREGEP